MKILNFMLAENSEVKRRVLIALSLLAGAKLLNITVPFFFKHTIDMVNMICFSI